MRSIKEHGPIAKAEAACTAGPEEFVGNDVSGQGGAGSPGSTELRPTALGLANTPTRQYADPPTRFPVPPSLADS